MNLRVVHVDDYHQHLKTLAHLGMLILVFCRVHLIFKKWNRIFMLVKRLTIAIIIKNRQEEVDMMKKKQVNPA
jgi:hypothetical protein